LYHISINLSRQSAGNLLIGRPILVGSSETKRQLPNSINKRYYSRSIDQNQFNHWLAGIIDGDGNLDLRKINNLLVLKAIRIKLHNRDIGILTRIQNHLHFGRIIVDKNKSYSMYIISTKKEMINFVNLINGNIRIKVDSFKRACDYLDIKYIESNPIIQPNDPYLAGLIDTDGSIIFNYNSNRIECNIELKYNEYTKNLDFSQVIPNYQPDIYLRRKSNQIKNRYFQSIVFKYQTVRGMDYLYDYIVKNRLYSEMKYYRAIKIKEFLKIRSYQKYPRDSLEFQIYREFLLDYIKYMNPL
jgi:hypothetical protein